jgi:CheY-like chemotaxis protein
MPDLTTIHYKFIVVEDSPNHLNAIVRYLRRYIPNSTIISAEYMDQAIQMYSENEDTNLMIVDIELYKSYKEDYMAMGGLEIMKEIRKRNDTINFVVYTNYEQAELQPTLKQVRAEFVKKYAAPPIPLISKVVKILNIVQINSKTLWTK